MYIAVYYNNNTKAVIRYFISTVKQSALTSGDIRRVNVVLNDTVPPAFYENFDNYKVTINAQDSTLATLSVITTANNNINRVIGGSGLPANSPYKNLTAEIAEDVTGNVTAAKRAEAIVALPWAVERANTQSTFKVL